MKFKQISVIFINITILFFLIDFLTTNYLGIRNPSIVDDEKAFFIEPTKNY